MKERNIKLIILLSLLIGLIVFLTTFFLRESKQEKSFNTEKNSKGVSKENLGSNYVKKIKVNPCSLPKFEIDISKKDIQLVYQLSRCRLDTFDISLDNSVGFLKNALTSHFKIDEKISFATWVSKFRKVDYSENPYKNLADRSLIDSFLVISKEVLIITNSVVEYPYEQDLEAHLKGFKYNLSDYILEKGDKYLSKRIDKNKVKTISLHNFDRLMITPTHTYFNRKQLSTELDEAKLIEKYLRSIGLEKVNSRYKFLIIGDDDLTLREIGIKEFDVVQHFTINFAIIYPYRSSKSSKK